MHRLTLKIPPLLVLFIFCILQFVIATGLPALSFNMPFAPILALGFALSGVFVALAGVVEFRQHKTSLNPLHPNKAQTLVCNGIFRYSRNPMYLGMLFFLIGTDLYISNIVALATGPAFFMMYMNQFQIQPEESVMAEKFGDAFCHYRRTVRRWL